MKYINILLIGLMAVSYSVHSEDISSLEKRVAKAEQKLKSAQKEYKQAQQALHYAKNAKIQGSKTGEKEAEKPCTCVFNNKRQWNPEKIIWNNEYWRCGKYNDNGTCSYVEKIIRK